MTTTFGQADFRKSSYSNPDKNCVGVAWHGDLVELRDTKTAFGSADDRRLRTNPAALAALVTTLSR